MLIRLLYCYENPSGARHRVCQPALPFSGCVSGGLSSFSRSSTTYCSTGVAAVAAAAAAAAVAATMAREGRGPTESLESHRGHPPRKHHVRSYVRLTSADRSGLLLRTDIITAPRRISRARRFREASGTRARRGRQFRCMGYPTRIAASNAVSCLAYEARATMQIVQRERERGGGNATVVWTLSRGTSNRKSNSSFHPTKRSCVSILRD